MLTKICLSLLLLQMCHLVNSQQKCSDCQLYYTCKAAVDHARYKKNEETQSLFERAECGVEMEDDIPVYKVCCSMFPDISPGTVGHPVKVIENRLGMGATDKLPKKCGKILGDRIFGGKIAKLHEFPWMVLISYETREGLQFQCGGTVITSKYVLTAAHCVVDKNIAGVRIGEYDVNTDTDCEYGPNTVKCESHLQDMYVAEKIPHKNFQKSPPENDIALLRVDGEILFNYTNVAPICLPASSSLRDAKIDHKNGTVAGWGYTESGRESSILLKVDVPIKTEAECKGYYNRNNRDAVKKQFCAGELNKDSCNGDSGGPLMMKDNYEGVNSYVQYGIVSHGPTKCGSLFPGVYTDVREYVDWILDNIKD